MPKYTNIPWPLQIVMHVSYIDCLMQSYEHSFTQPNYYIYVVDLFMIVGCS